MAENIGAVRPFGDLQDEDRVRAILATVREPVSKEMIFDFAGVDAVSAQSETLMQIESIMAEYKVEQPEGPDKFWVPLEKQEESIKNLGVDWTTVRGQIADILWKEIGLE